MYVAQKAGEGREGMRAEIDTGFGCKDNVEIKPKRWNQVIKQEPSGIVYSTQRRRCMDCAIICKICLPMSMRPSTLCPLLLLHLLSQHTFLCEHHTVNK